MLEDLSKEQSFEVTYVDIEDKTEDNETQCLVQVTIITWRKGTLDFLLHSSPKFYIKFS